MFSGLAQCSLKRATQVRSLHALTKTKTTSINLARPDNDHKSLVVITTPSLLNQLIPQIQSYITKDGQLKDMNTVVVACVDTIAQSRFAYSQLWTKSDIKITNFETNEDRDSRMTKKKDPLSADPVRFDKSWKHWLDETLFSINFTNWNLETNVRLGSSVFQNDQMNTSFFITRSTEGGINQKNLHNMSSISIDVNLDDIPHQEPEIEYTNRLTEIPMVENPEESDPVYTITDFEGNLLKSINDRGASDYLINNSLVMGEKKDLYFKLYTDEDVKESKPWKQQFYKLLVGANGWGEKQAFMAIDPCVGLAGHRHVKMYQYDPVKPPCNISTADDVKVVVETSELEDGFIQPPTQGTEEVSISGVFAMGSELGFQVDGVWHKANGDIIQVTR